MFPRMPRGAPELALASTLRRLREERGLTLEALAYRAGITVGSLGRIELGHTSPTWTTVQMIADALEVPLAELGAAVDAERK
jgi:transcriptional regulator with XRE-family HTH domain